MTTPIEFPSTTHAFGFPLLFAGQAQKEFFLNQSLTMLDSLLTRTVDASLSTPPQDPPSGACYRIVEPAADAWSGREHGLAVWIGGAWAFVPPARGMAVFDRAAGVLLRYTTHWQSAATPAAIEGGEIVDVEAREAVSRIIEALRLAGVFPDTT